MPATATATATANANATAAAPVRDALTLWAYAATAVIAVSLNAFGPALAEIRLDVGFSRTVAGLHSTAVAAGMLTAGSLAEPLRVRLGWARLPGLAAVLLASAVGALALGSAVPVTLVGSFAFGAAIALLLVVVPSVVARRHGAATAAVLAEANALASAAGFLAPLSVAGGMALLGSWTPALLLVGLGLLPVLALLADHVGATGEDRRATGERERGPAAPLGARYRRWWAALCLGVSVEFAMLLWAAEDARVRLGLGGGAAALSASAFVAGMALARVAGGRLALHSSEEALFRGSLAVALAGFLLFRVLNDPVLAIAGQAVTGVGVGLLYPLSLAGALAAAAPRQPLGAARTAIASGLAIGLAPVTLGALADATTLSTGYLLVPLLLLAAAVAAPAPGSHKRSITVG